MTDIRTALADYFNEQATWRAHKADEYPDDRRNALSAEGLRALSDYVMSLPPDDPRLTQIMALDWAPGGQFLAGEDSGRVASSVGFDSSPDPSRDLDIFVEACIRDATVTTGVWDPEADEP